ncbi:glycosyltransferase family 39 protein [Leptolyngbya sp. FACHB-261]|uniref:glycosyltransferase family 39 protein n=1 Tax=Leptolyngbya sp. FACHB-261 TaxID=2692806 RepID=UPI001683F0F9|nr:glycosyltransferase family 39 protein [Leptolyngbya sp. FACHB-261]MBD2100158.1 glycosyltransferase family 39 protein [Leptolyngbya sp. FACHB-261]
MRTSGNEVSTGVRQTSPLNARFQLVWLRPLIIVVLLLGIFFRFANLDHRIYWADEAYTSFRISGSTQTEFRKLQNGPVFSVQELQQQYQQVNPQKGLMATLRGLAKEEPQLTPLYFVLVRFWAEWFGDSVAMVRSLSAVISLLAFPAIYWLCLELFGAPLTGWIGMALIAVSPFHLLFAQEARPYYLWAVTILVSCAALLRAQRLQNRSSWGIYAATVALGFYSHLFFALVSIAHGCYVLVMENFRLTRRFIAYLLASAAGLLAFLPWLVVMADNLSITQKVTAASVSAERTPLLDLAKVWILNLNRIFVDWNYSFDASNLCLYLILLLEGFAFYILYRRTAKQTWLFVFSLTGVAALALLLPDLLLGGRQSSTGRYLIPCWIGIELAVVYLLANQLSTGPAHPRWQKFWQLVTVALISGGIASCVLISQSQVWWNKALNAPDLQIAQLINQTERPLVVGNTRVLTLSYMLKPEVRFQMLKSKKPAKIAEGFSDIFLIELEKEDDVQSGPSLREQLAQGQNFKLESVYDVTYQTSLVNKKRKLSLWKLERG